MSIVKFTSSLSNITAPSIFRGILSAISYKEVSIGARLSSISEVVIPFLSELNGLTNALLLIVCFAGTLYIFKCLKFVWEAVLTLWAWVMHGHDQLDRSLLLNFRVAKVSMLAPYALTKYVERDELQDRLRNHMGNAAVGPNGQYLVLYGPRGVGKSTAVNFVSHNSRGVVIVKVNERTTEETIMQIIANNKNLRDMTFAEFLAAMRNCSVLLLVDKFIPVVVFDVERSRSDSEDSRVLAMVHFMSKELSQYCKVVVVVSDANAALVFPTDLLRKRFICVEDLSDAEAYEMCTKLVPKMPATVDELARVFSLLGTRPSRLIDLHAHLLDTPPMTVDEYIANALSKATDQLTSFLHQRLVLALKKSPTGVHVSSLRDVYDNGVNLNNPTLVAPAIKLSEAILYNIERSEYRLQSRVYATALSALQMPGEADLGSAEGNRHNATPCTVVTCVSWVRCRVG